ncbi:MAG: phosphorylated adapter RNA export RNA-binding domain-containing protein [Chloroflexota bacterium]|nr:phosphorylated adapter RNA export RNA-binding domain-containing protein [Chloroflexota bacterium]
MTTLPQDRATLDAITGEIATQLGETEEEPIRQIRRAVRILGEHRVRTVVARALDVEAAGGMMCADGSQKRSLGGVFFILMRDDVGRKDFYRIFKGGQQQRTNGPGAAARTTTVPFDWATFGANAAEAMSEAGEATTVKLTVIGKPGKVVERGDVALVALRSEKVPSLPKGVPAPPSPQTDYMVLVGMKQWRKVAAALAADPADKVIMEGYPTVQPEFAGITVYATSATTTGIQAGKRAAQTVTTS